MKSLKQFILEAKNEELENLLKPYNENNIEDFNGKNVDLANYLEKNCKQDRVKGDISKALKSGDAFVKYTKENEYGGIYSITFGFISDKIDMVNFHMKTNSVKIDVFSPQKWIIDPFDDCFKLDASLLSGIEKLIK